MNPIRTLFRQPFCALFFCGLALAPVRSVPAADVQFYVIEKRASYTQTGTGLPVLDNSTPTPYRFSAFVSASGPSLVSAASLRIPSGATQTLTAQSSTDFQFKQNASSPSALDSAFPAGNYVYSLTTVHDGPRTQTLAEPAANYPTAPRINNFTAAQAVNAGANFTLTWDAFTGGTTNDLIEVEVDDSATGNALFSTPLPGSPGTLEGNATGVVIPGNTLAANTTYLAKVTFQRVVVFDETSYPGATGVVLFSARTSLALTTAGTATGGTDVTLVHLAEGQLFIQTSASAPALNGSTPFVFDAGASLSASNLASGTVTLPNSTVKNFSANGDELKIKESYATVSALSAADPVGTYTVTLNTLDNGTKSIPLALSATAPFPTTPQISNFTAAQAIDASASFTLTWNPFSNGTMADAISVEIDDAMGNTVLRSGDIGTASALNGAATSFVIPANQLQAGQSYNARLMFVKVTALDTNSYPGAVAVAGYFKQTSFQITTRAGGGGGLDVTQIHVAKGQLFLQTSSATPTLNGSTPYVFDASAGLSTSNVATGSLTLPNTTIKTFTVNPDELKIKESYATMSALDTADPIGNYTVTLNTVDNGTKTIVLLLSSTTPYPNTPQISNFTAAQAINAAADFTLSWSPLSGGTASDFIFVDIDDSLGNGIFSTGDIGAAGSLDGTATSVVIPANRLQAGQTYSARLTFVKGTAMDTNSYPGVIAVAGYYKETDFSIATTGSGPTNLDVMNYMVVKGQQFFQNSTSPPAPRPDAPFAFSSFLSASATGVVTSVGIQLPNGGSQALATQDNGGTFEFLNGFASKTALDTAYAAGSYTWSINTVHNGLQQPVLSLPGDNYPGTVPYVTNFAAAQAIDPTADFNLGWSPFGGGTTNDFIQIVIQDGNNRILLMTPMPGAPGASNALTSSVLIPHNTLSFGGTYFATLVFARASTDTTSYPGVIGIAGYFISTTFNLAAKGLTPAVLSKPTRLAIGGFQFHLTGQSSQAYQLDVSTDLAGWAPLTNVTTAADGTADIVDPQVSGFSHRFYRAASAGSSSSASLSLSFNQYASFGSFGVNSTPSGAFPVALNGYRAILGVHNDPALPATTNVTFTGPAGSGLTNTPADFQNVESAGSATFGSPDVSNPAAAPGGAWTVSYKGVPQNFTMPDPQGNTRLVIPLPTVTLNNGVLQQISWVYKSANGSTLTGPPSFMSNLQIQISGQNNVRLYDSPSLGPATTNFTLPANSPINWSSVTWIAMAYEDDLHNSYVVFFNH